MKTCDVRTLGGTDVEEGSRNTMTKIIANKGDKVVRLVAEFRAWPQTNVKWYKENRELEHGSKYAMVYENSVAELVVRNIAKNDAGSYTVVASSPFGEALLSAELFVEDGVPDQKNGNTHLLPSILVQPLSDQMIRVGKKARFTVAASFPPEPQVHWYKDHEKCEDSDRFQISKQGGVCTLDIMMVEPSDDGIWKCEVVTSYGYAVSMAKLHAIVPKGYRKPEFLEGLKALLTEQGTVSLECKVVGVPTPLLRWFKDGKEIKAGDMFNLRMQGNDESSLGTYACVAINCMGKAVSSAQVTVMEKTEDKLKPKVKVEDPVPYFLENLEDKTIKVGENLRFTVRVRTPPSVQVHWYRQQDVIEAGEKFHLTQVDDGIFHLDVVPVEITDEGEWRCVAINQYGQTISACNLTLTVPKYYRSPEFVEDLQAIFTDDGLVSFECKVVGVPTPILRWYKDGMELKPGDVHQLSGTNSLGSYSCVAKNCMGLASSLAELTLEDIYGAKERRKPPAKHPPQFTQHLKDDIAVIGDSLRLTVSVTCPPAPEITWYKDNIRVEGVPRYKLRRERNGIYHLDIDVLDIADQGSWKCLAVNDYGHSLTQCVLKVIVPKQYKKPKFIENLRAVLSEEGTVSLECKVVGVPQPVLKWYKDGIELKAGDIYKIVSGEGGTSSLGTYTCEARNCMGMASSTAALLAFDDKYLRDQLRTDAYQHELSTIEERSEFSTYGTPSIVDNWDESKADLEFSIYETPDITEDEARQIVEMFADEVSEYNSTREAPELPPLRFIKESAMVGNILMEALIIDVPIECCSRVEDMSQKTPFDNLATEADVADISMMDPVVVDLPYDYSEAASLHELKIDFSAEGEVVVKDASVKEAIIVQAQEPLAAHGASIEENPMDNLAATAHLVDKSVLQPLVVTAQEQLQTTGDNVLEKADSEHVAVEVHMRDGMESAINATDMLPIFYNEEGPFIENMVEASSEQLQQHPAEDTNVQRPTTLDQGEAISEDITPSENLGTEADVESIASLEEFATDYVNGFADEPMDGEEYFPARTPVADSRDFLEDEPEIQRIQETFDEAGRSTPNFESALESQPDELMAELNFDYDQMAATPTPTPDIYQVLELEGQSSKPNIADDDVDLQGACAMQTNEPGLLADLANTVLQRAAEGIMTTAVIAESLVAAAASMILPLEEQPGTSRDCLEEQAFALEESVAGQELAEIEQISLLAQEAIPELFHTETAGSLQGNQEGTCIMQPLEAACVIQDNPVAESVAEIVIQAAMQEAACRISSPNQPLDVYSPDEMCSPVAELSLQEAVTTVQADIEFKPVEAIIQEEQVVIDGFADNLLQLSVPDVQHELAVLLQEPAEAMVTNSQLDCNQEESVPMPSDIDVPVPVSAASVAQCHMVVRSVSLQESITPAEALSDVPDSVNPEAVTALQVESPQLDVVKENAVLVEIDSGQPVQKVEDVHSHVDEASKATESSSSEAVTVETVIEEPGEKVLGTLDAASISNDNLSEPAGDAEKDSLQPKNGEALPHDPTGILGQNLESATLQQEMIHNTQVNTEHEDGQGNVMGQSKNMSNDDKEASKLEDSALVPHNAEFSTDVKQVLSGQEEFMLSHEGENKLPEKDHATVFDQSPTFMTDVEQVLPQQGQLNGAVPDGSVLKPIQMQMAETGQGATITTEVDKIMPQQGQLSNFGTGEKSREPIQAEMIVAGQVTAVITPVEQALPQQGQFTNTSVDDAILSPIQMQMGETGQGATVITNVEQAMPQQGQLSDAMLKENALEAIQMGTVVTGQAAAKVTNVEQILPQQGQLTDAAIVEKVLEPLQMGAFASGQGAVVVSDVTPAMPQQGQLTDAINGNKVLESIEMGTVVTGQSAATVTDVGQILPQQGQLANAVIVEKGMECLQMSTVGTEQSVAVVTDIKHAMPQQGQLTDATKRENVLESIQAGIVVTGQSAAIATDVVQALPQQGKLTDSVIGEEVLKPLLMESVVMEQSATAVTDFQQAVSQQGQLSDSITGEKVLEPIQVGTIVTGESASTVANVEQAIPQQGQLANAIIGEKVLESIQLETVLTGQSAAVVTDVKQVTPQQGQLTHAGTDESSSEPIQKPPASSGQETCDLSDQSVSVIDDINATFDINKSKKPKAVEEMQASLDIRIKAADETTADSALQVQTIPKQSTLKDVQNKHTEITENKLEEQSLSEKCRFQLEAAEITADKLINSCAAEAIKQGATGAAKETENVNFQQEEFISDDLTDTFRDSLMEAADRLAEELVASCILDAFGSLAEVIALLRKELQNLPDEVSFDDAPKAKKGKSKKLALKKRSLSTNSEGPESPAVDKSEAKKSSKSKKKGLKNKLSLEEKSVSIPESLDDQTSHQDEQNIKNQEGLPVDLKNVAVASEMQLTEALGESTGTIDDFSKTEAYSDSKKVPDLLDSVDVKESIVIAVENLNIANASEMQLPESLAESTGIVETFSQPEAHSDIKDDSELLDPTAVKETNVIVIDNHITEQLAAEVAEDNASAKAGKQSLESEATGEITHKESSEVLQNDGQQVECSQLEEISKDNLKQPKDPIVEKKTEEDKSEPKKVLKKKKKSSMKKLSSEEAPETELTKEVPADETANKLSSPVNEQQSILQSENKENIPETQNINGQESAISPSNKDKLVEKLEENEGKDEVVSSEVSQEIPKSEGGKEISRLKRSTSRKDKRRRGSKKSDDGDSQSRRSSRADSIESSTGELTDEGEDFAPMSVESSRQKRVSRTVSGGDLGKIHEMEELLQDADKRRSSCPTVDSLPEIQEQSEPVSKTAESESKEIPKEQEIQQNISTTDVNQNIPSTEKLADSTDTCVNGNGCCEVKASESDGKKSKETTKTKKKKSARKTSKDSLEAAKDNGDSKDQTDISKSCDMDAGKVVLNGNLSDNNVVSSEENDKKSVPSMQTENAKCMPDAIADANDNLADKNVIQNGSVHDENVVAVPANENHASPAVESNEHDNDKDEGIEKEGKYQEINEEDLGGKDGTALNKDGDKGTFTESDKSEDKSSGYSTEDAKCGLGEKLSGIASDELPATEEGIHEKKLIKTKKTKSKKAPEKPEETVPAEVREPIATDEMEKMKRELLALDLEMKPSKLFIEELNSSFEDSSTDKTPANVVIESVSDDGDETLKNLDDEMTIKEIDDSMMGIEEIPLDDLSIEDVIENMRTLRRLQTITEVDEITDDNDGDQHIVIATLRPCWEEDINRRAHSLQPAKEQVTHTVETIRRCSSGDVPGKKKPVRTKDTPVFIMKLQDLTVPVGYRMRLTCCVIGTPDPKVQWLKNGVPITCGMGYREITDFGICILEIPRADHSDSGEYTCIAKNDHGEDMTTGKLTVRGKSKPGLVEPAFTRSILDMKGHCGDSITMDCTVIGWPTPNVAWIKDGHPLELDSRMETSVTSGGTHRLVIEEARLEDSGIYKCMAQNALGKDEITAAVKIMDKAAYRTSRFVRDSLTKKSRTDQSASEHGITVSGYGEAPKFLLELKDRTAHLGSAITFKCEITGKPRPELCWLHNGRSLTPSSHVKLSQQGNTYILTILDTSYSDLGMYTCRARNSGGATYTSGCLHFGLQDEEMEFGLAPVFIAKPSSVNVGKHEEIVLACKVDGKPRPKVTWLKGARDMSLSRRAYKDSKGDIHKLIIHRAMNVDDGEYIVEARNKLGKEVVKCSVTVDQSNEDDVWDYHRTTSALNVLRGYRPYVPRKELPGPIGGEPKVTDTGRNWVTLVWPRPVNDGGSSIMAYRIEACELPGKAWEEVGLSPITMCDVYNLKPESQYLFRVSARNMFGWGQPVAMTNAMAISRRPDMPHFTSIPPSFVQTSLGADVSLECLVSGHPEPVITWYKDRERIRAMGDSRLQMSFDGVAAILTIHDIQADDEGCYLCEANSDGGRATTFSVLAVGDEQVPSPGRSSSRHLAKEELPDHPPVFSMRLRDRTVQSNNLVRLTCQVQGSPSPNITWFKDDRKIRKSEYETFQEGNFYTLEIAKACEDDAGEYAVVAENNHGGIACKCRLIVDSDCGRLSHAPTFSQQLEDLTVTPGDTATLHCKVVHLGGRTTWFQNGQKLAHSRKYRMKTMPDGTCVLSILGVILDDSGTYTCVASNQSGRTASTCNLRIDTSTSTGEPEGIEHDLKTHVGYSKAPMFLTKPRSTEVVEFDNVEMLCEVIGDPKPEVLWLRDGLTFKYQKDPEHFIRLGDGPFYRLDIPSVTIDDTGTYAVLARNCHGDTKAIISLQVFARGQGIEEAMSYKSQSKARRVATRPEVTQVLKDLQCADGDSVVFECRINATPLPEIRWEKDGHVIRNGEDFQIIQDGAICRLRILEVFPEDQGEYVCVAYNDAGKVTTTAKLYVQRSEDESFSSNESMEPRQLRPIRKRAVVETPTRSKKKMVGPKFVTHPHNRVVDEGDTVKFTCSIAGHPEPLVQWDKHGRLIKADGRLDLVDREDLHSLVIRDVVPSDAGLYTVTVSNCIGRVYATVKLDVVAKRKGKIAVPSPNLGSSGVSHPPPPPPSSLSPTKSSRVITITAYEVPTVHQPLSDTSVRQKDALFMACAISGHPTPTITWALNGRKIKNSRNQRSKYNGRLATLEIDRVMENSQKAVVTCTATNAHGMTQTSAKLTITECQPRPKKLFDSSLVTKLGRAKMSPGATPKIPNIEENTSQCRSSKNLYKTKSAINSNKLKNSVFRKLNCGGKCFSPVSHTTPQAPSQKSIASGLSEALYSSVASAISDSEKTPPPEFAKMSVDNSTPLPPPLPSRNSYQSAVPLLADVISSCVNGNTSRAPSLASLQNGCSNRAPSLSSVHSLESCAKGSPPTFLKELMDVVARDGQNLTLTVQVSGRAPFEIIWIHNDQEIIDCDVTRYVTHEHWKYSLVIADIFPEDSGMYTCEAYNAFGYADTSCRVHVTEPNSTSEPSTVRPRIVSGLLEQTECVDGEHLRLGVHIIGIPIPIVEWFKDGQKLQSFIRIKTGYEGNRHICEFSRVRPRDAGIYSVVATNNLGKATVSTALSIRTHSSSPSRQMSSSSEIECNDSTCNERREEEVTTVPPDEQEAGLNEFASGDKENVSTIESTPKTLLPSTCSAVLFNVLPSSEVVQVHCEQEKENEIRDEILAEDLEDSATTILITPAPVVKESPAQIIRGPLNTTVLQGQKAILKVHFIGKPQCAVKWIKGGRMVECSERIKMETCEEMSCLTLDNVHSDDSGKYIVVVENAHGADCHFASLAVEGPPNPPASKPVVSQVTAYSATLCWYGSSFDGGSVLTGYIIEMARTNNESLWHVVKSNCHSTSYVVTGLESGTEYVFRIRAQNVHGVSSPSKLSDPVYTKDRGSSDEEDLYDNVPPESRIVVIKDGAHFDDLYEIKEELGKGKFGRVHKVIEKNTQQDYAAKFIRCIKSSNKDNVRLEVEIMSQLHHPKLLQLIAAFDRPREMVLVLEIITGGELFERVVAEDFDLTEKDCILFIRQICEGVRYMHSQSIMHLDLKPENILCLQRDTHQIKLIDFGLARKYDPDNLIRVLFGTPEFVAPEVVCYDTISLASDMWSVGVICYVLLSGVSPFMGNDDAETFSKVTRAKFDYDDEIFEDISDDAKNFISSLLVKKKEKRFTAQQCLKHQWLAQHERTMSSVKLCKDKLKKFIIRRKWQKTGNAILALGRMVSLSGLSSRRSPFKTYNSCAGSSMSDYGSGGSDCDTLSSVSSHAPVRAASSIPETDQDSLLADSSSESYHSDRKNSNPINGKLQEAVGNGL